MTKSSRWMLAGALASFTALAACAAKGNAGSGSTGGQPPPISCLGPSFSSACASCIQGSCEAALGAYGGDCSDYINCYCPNGEFNASAQMSQTCLQQATKDPSCLSSVDEMNNCVTQTCASSCGSSNGASSSGGGGGSGGSGGSGGGGSGGGQMAACGVAFSTGACASCVQSKCCTVTQACGGDQNCLDIIDCIHNCGSSDTSCQQKCVSSASTTAQSELSNAVNCWASSCGASGC